MTFGMVLLMFHCPTQLLLVLLILLLMLLLLLLLLLLLVVVGFCEGVMYLTSRGRSTDTGLQLGKACYSL